MVSFSYLKYCKCDCKYSLCDCFKEIFGLHSVSNNKWQCYFYRKCSWSLWATAQWNINISIWHSIFMSFLQQKLLRSLFTHVNIYIHSFTVSESRFVSSVTFILIDYRYFALWLLLMFFGAICFPAELMVLKEKVLPSFQD